MDWGIEGGGLGGCGFEAPVWRHDGCDVVCDTERNAREVIRMKAGKWNDGDNEGEEKMNIEK